MSESLIEAAEKLAPLWRSKAREAELARRPLDGVIDAVRESGIFSMMVPKCYGGHEADIDTFFEVSLALSRADASMGWLIGFYIERGFWSCGYPETFQKQLFADNDFILAPAALNVAGGKATRVDGGYRLDGQWQWGTGIVHGDWVMAGAMVEGVDAIPLPLFFALPIEDVETVDTWQVSGMCGTGSFDFRIDDVFIPEDRAVSMIELTDATGEASRLHAGALYQTPLIPILGFAAALPMLGDAQMALEEHQTQTKAKIAASLLTPPGAPDRNAGKPSVVARAALSIDAAELMLRDVLADVMVQRSQASMETRATWMTRIAYAVFECRDAVQDIASVTDASGSRLENPIQRAVRDIAAGSNHAIFDREMRYADYGKLLFGQPVMTMLS